MSESKINDSLLHEDKPKERPLLNETFLSIISFICALITGLAMKSEGLSYSDGVYAIGTFGEIWLRLIQLFLLPLIGFSLVTAIVELRNIKVYSGRIPCYYYMLTGLISVAIGGAFIGNYIINNNIKMLYNPSKDVDIYDTIRPAFAAEGYLSTWLQIEQVFFAIFPLNVVTSAAQMNFLGVIFFLLSISLFLERDSVFVKMCTELNIAVRKALTYVLYLLPLALFSFLVPIFANVTSFSNLCSYSGILFGSILAGFCIQVLFVYPLLYLILTKLERNPYAVLGLAISVLCKASFTSKSNKEVFTEAVTLSTSLNSKATIIGLVLSFGSLMNVDAFALCFPPVVMFLSIVQGTTLCTGQIITLTIVGCLGSLGLNSLPHSGLLVIIMTMQTIAVKINGLIGIFIFLDLFFSPLRLASNTIGDIFATRICDLYSPGVLSEEQNVAIKGLTDDILRAQRKISLDESEIYVTLSKNNA